MEDNLIVKCCSCGDYFNIVDMHTLKWEDKAYEMCNDCFEKIPETKDDQNLFILR